MPIINLSKELARKPLLGAFLGLLFLGQLLFTFKGIQHYPFLLYGMYSQPLHPQNDASFEITINGTPLPAWDLPELTRTMIENSLTKMDRKDMDYYFFLWLEHYVSTAIGETAILHVVKVHGHKREVIHE